MTPTTDRRFLAVSLLLLLTAQLTSAEEPSPPPSPRDSSFLTRLLTERPKPAPSPPVLPDDVQADTQPAGLRSWSQPVDELPERVLETPPRPLPQVMFTKNGTAADALAPPLGAAQVAPPPRRLVDVDVCQGYYDVMGQFDSAFNCSKDTYIYCCGSCHFRFCCPERGQQLEQHLCKNYDSPDWAKTPAIDISSVMDPMGTIDPLRMQSHNTGFVIGGVVVFMVAVAVGIKVVFNKVQQEANHRDLNMPRWVFTCLSVCLCVHSLTHGCIRAG